jgi:hypothetical protein
MVGGVLCFSFHFPQFAVSSLGGWICAVGILRFIFYGICSRFLRFLIFQLLIVDNLLQEVSENSAPWRGPGALLERIRLEYQRADLEVKIGHLEADVAYLWSDYLFLTEGAKKDALFVAICGLDSEVEQLKTKLASVSGQLYYS